MKRSFTISSFNKLSSCTTLPNSMADLHSPIKKKMTLNPEKQAKTYLKERFQVLDEETNCPPYPCRFSQINLILLAQ